MDRHGDSQPGSSEGARTATGDGPGQKKKRFSARRKVEIVLYLLCGGDLELYSRELGMNVSRLSKWREQFLSAGQAVLKKRPQVA